MNSLANEFERRESTPQYWCNKSTDLRAAAGAVWFCMTKENEQNVVEDLDFGTGFSMQIASYPVFLMLCGLSLELMYKAVCVAKHINFKANHNLLELCKLAGVPFTKIESQFLALFTESVIWQGKYPVPTEKRKHALFDLNNAWRTLLCEDVNQLQKLKIRRFNGSIGWEIFNTLWSKACEIFYEESYKLDC